jgi:hypothetical protein
MDPSFSLFLPRLLACAEQLRCFDAIQNDPGIDSPSRAHGGDPITVVSRQAPRAWGQPPSLETRPRTWGQPPRLEDRVKVDSKDDGGRNAQSRLVQRVT